MMQQNSLSLDCFLHLSLSLSPSPLEVINSLYGFRSEEALISLYIYRSSVGVGKCDKCALSCKLNIHTIIVSIRLTFYFIF